MIKHSGGLKLRKALLTVQFITSITLITSTLIVYLQINYLQSLDKGFERRNIITIKPPYLQSDLEKNMKQHTLFISEIQKIPGVLSATASAVIPGEIISQKFSNFHRDDTSSETEYPVFDRTTIDENYFKTFSIQLIGGKNFSPDGKLNVNKIIVNKKATSVMGYKNTRRSSWKDFNLQVAQYTLSDYRCSG